MPERSPFFEQYLKDLQNKEKNAPKKGADARKGKLEVPELLDEEGVDADSFESKKSSDEDREGDMAAE